MQARENPLAVMGWEDIEAHIRTMVEKGTYMSADEAYLVDEGERRRTAGEIFYFFREGIEEAPEETGIRFGN